MYELLLEYIETRILRNVVISCCIMYFVVNYVVTMIKPKIHGNFYQIIYVVYDRNHYFGFGPIPIPKPKLIDSFGRYSNRYRNPISKGKSSYQLYGVFFES